MRRGRRIVFEFLTQAREMNGKLAWFWSRGEVRLTLSNISRIEFVSQKSRVSYDRR